MVESSQKTELKITLPTEIGSRMRNVTIPRGARISSLISLKLGQDLLEKCRDSALCNTSSAGYIDAYQDFVAWFSGEENGSRIDIVMRVDLGNDIPNWAFLATIAATGIGSMAALREMGAAALRASKAPWRTRPWNVLSVAVQYFWFKCLIHCIWNINPLDFKCDPLHTRVISHFREPKKERRYNKCCWGTHNSFNLS